VTTGAQDEEQQKRDYKDIRTSPATGRLQVEPGPAGNDLSTRHRSLEWQAMQFYGYQYGLHWSYLFSLGFDSTALPNSIAKSQLNHSHLV
jgi:hypothetical protein